MFVGTKDEGIWACTDALGVQHLCVRKIGGDVVVGPDVFKIASCAPVYLDSIAAYELFGAGNPLGGRTLFSEIRLIPPATQMRLDTPHSVDTYWSLPQPSPTDPERAIGVFIEALLESVARNWRPDCVQELTGGRDSTLLLAAHLKRGIPVRTWTHGLREDFDMVAASARAKALGVAHQPVFIAPLENLSPVDAGNLAMEFLQASGGQSNILEYWYLRWVVEKLEGNGSISGGGGEIFRGNYYKWTGRGLFPTWVTERMFLHWKLRHSMPFPSVFLDKEFVRKGENAIRHEVNNALKYNRKNPYHSFDAYFVNPHMQDFAGTTWSITGQWRRVRAPYCDPDVIDCLSVIPIELRSKSRLALEATRRLLGNPLPLNLPHLQKKAA